MRRSRQMIGRHATPAPRSRGRRGGPRGRGTGSRGRHDRVLHPPGGAEGREQRPGGLARRDGLLRLGRRFRADPADRPAEPRAGGGGDLERDHVVNTPDAPGCCASIFRDFAWSTFDNRLYWTRSDNLVGTLAGDTVSSAPMPAEPWGIVAAPDGGAWMTEYGSSNVAPAYSGNRIARVGAGLGLAEYPNLAMQTGELRRDALRRQAEGDRARARRQAVVRPGRGGQPRLPDRHDRRHQRLHRVPALPDDGAVLGRVHRHRAQRRGSRRGRHRLVHERGQEDDRALRARRRRLRGVPARGIDPALGSGTPRAIRKAPDGALWAAVTAATPPRAPTRSCGSSRRVSPTVDDLQARRRAAAARGRARARTATSGSRGTATGGGPIGRLTAAGSRAGPDAHADADADPPRPPRRPATDADGDPHAGGGGRTSTSPSTTRSRSTSPTVIAINVGIAQVTDPTVRGNAINANQICVGPPSDRCSLVYLIQTHEYVTGFPGAQRHDRGGQEADDDRQGDRDAQGRSVQEGHGQAQHKGNKLLKKQGFKATLTVTQSHERREAEADPQEERAVQE